MKSRTARLASLFVAAGCVLGVTKGVYARDHAAKPAFKYVGGTVMLPERCQGKLEMNADSMTFQCTDGSARIPYSAIRFMQYRTDISHKVRSMKPRWKVKPQLFTPMFGGKGNRYFTIVYQEDEHGPTNTLVLEVSPDDMRPYLAEIDVKVGQRVDVEYLGDDD
jgi:hypothetical protein